MDYGRFKYEQTKKLQEAKKKQTTFQVKEIKVRPKTDTHDLEIKIGHIKKFIGKKKQSQSYRCFQGGVKLHSPRKAGNCLQKLLKTLKNMQLLNRVPRWKAGQCI